MNGGLGAPPAWRGGARSAKGRAHAPGGRGAAEPAPCDLGPGGIAELQLRHDKRRPAPRHAAAAAAAAQKGPGGPQPRDPQERVRGDEREFLAGADSGCIAENVYLFCAGVGLGTVVRGLIDRRRLATALGLSRTERVTLAQTVGHPAPVQVP